MLNPEKKRKSKREGLEMKWGGMGMMHRATKMAERYKVSPIPAIPMGVGVEWE